MLKEVYLDNLVPLNTLKLRQKDKAWKLVDFAMQSSPFYKKHLKTYDKSLRKWESIPLLTGEDIKKNLPPNGDGLLTDSTATHIYASGASGGEPKYIFRSVDEYPGYIPAVAEALSLTGLNKGSIVANLFHCGALYTSFLFFEEVLRTKKCISLPIGHHLSISETIKILKLFPPDVIAATPSSLTRIAEHITLNKLSLPIKLVYYGSEHLFLSQRDLLSKAFQTKNIYSACYAGTDYGPVGYSCKHTKSGLHHIYEMQTMVEVLDPVTLAPLPPGETGMIVVTNLHRFVVPIIRYITGDLGCFVDSDCKCGSTHRLLELKGRNTNDLLIVNRAINTTMLADWLFEELGTHHPFQAIAEMNGTKQTLRIRIENNDLNYEAQNRCLEFLKKKMTNKTRELSLEALNLIVESVPKGSIPYNTRTGKTQYFIDNREK